MRLLIDENVPAPAAALLRAAGHDVATAAPGSPDRELLGRATQEGRLLVTQDRDFGGLVFRDGVPAPLGIILLRSLGADPEAVGRILPRLLDMPEIAWGRHFTVVRAEGVRQRPMPRRAE